MVAPGRALRIAQDGPSFFSGALQGPYTVSFLAGNEGMDIGDGYWGLCRGYYRDPFPNSLLSARQYTGCRVYGFRVWSWSWRVYGLGLGASAVQDQAASLSVGV